MLSPVAAGSVLVAAGLGWGWWRLLRLGARHRRADWGRPWLNRLDGINRWYCRRYHRLRADPVPLPAHGGTVLVANHLSGLDPLLMIAACGRPLRFVIAAEEYDRWWLRWFFDQIGCIPVNRHHRPDRVFYAARKALADGEVVALFPQGGIHVPGTPPGRLKRGAVYLASVMEVPLVALRIDGVSGAGLTFPALWKRSAARITASAAMRCERADADAVLTRIANQFDNQSAADVRPLDTIAD